jgi:hypothetical protein
VALNSQLGLDGFRGASIDWSTFLPDCYSAAPTAATCDAAAMTFSSAPQSYFQAAYLAQQDHVRYWVQVSTGDATSKALVANGWWDQDVKAIVAYYAATAHCTVAGGQCAPVTAWEPWDEANNSFSPSGQLYVQDILEPFYDAVKGAAPQDTVIGGSSLGVALSWWQQVVAAGGRSYMDAAGVHPYTGNNDSWDEDGTVAQVQQLEGVLGTTPIWFTEVGWWSNGPYDFLSQADTVASSMIWQEVLGVPIWGYYFDEGGWGNDGVSFSLIQDASTEDYVKPAALAVMEASKQLAGRSYLSSPQTGLPLSFEATFGPAPGGSDDLSAVWTDGLSLTAQVAVTSVGTGAVTLVVTDQWGNSVSYQLTPGEHYALPISSEMTYLAYPEGDRMSMSPTEAYGTDLALASAGAVASASSSASCCSAADAVNGNLVGGWQPAGNDSSPTITVNLAGNPSIDRVLVDGHSLGSLVGGPRDFTILVEHPDGSWVQVASVSGMFYDHASQVTFTPTQAQAVRMVVQDADYGGYAGGGVPSFWPGSSALIPQVHALQVYAAAPITAPLALGATS